MRTFPHLGLSRISLSRGACSTRCPDRTGRSPSWYFNIKPLCRLVGLDESR